MKTAITSCLAWFLVLGSTSFGAVVNGSFEDTPTFSGSGWNVQGLTFIQGTYLGIAPPDGSASQALLRTGDSGSGGTGASLALLADTLQVTLADITAVAPNATNGSAISQRITVRADDTLTFDWKFVTSEGAGQAQQDTAFFSVSRVGGTPQTSLLAHASSPGLVGFNEPPFSRQTNYFTSFPSSPPTSLHLMGTTSLVLELSM